MAGKMKEIVISGVVNSPKEADYWMSDFIDWIESRKETFGGGAHNFIQKPLVDFIGKEVFVSVELRELDQIFTRRLQLNYDSRKTPKDRIILHDRKGNVIFIMLPPNENSTKS